MLGVIKEFLEIMEYVMNLEIEKQKNKKDVIEVKLKKVLIYNTYAAYYLSLYAKENDQKKKDEFINIVK